MAEGIVIGNLTIPVIKGDKGDKGNAGEIVSISLVLLSPSSTAYAINNGSTTQAQIELGIPKGLSVSTININASGELVFTFNDNSTVNVGKVVGKGISEVAITEEYDFVVTYTDGTSVTACNLEEEILGAINDILEDYYTRTEIDQMGFITKEVNNLTNYTLKTNTGSSIELSINSSTYVMTLNLKNSAGTTISTGTIDLPLETMVVGATYDNTNKKIVLTFKNGSTIDVPVGDLVSGLQSEITNANKLSADLVDDTSTTHKFTSTSEKNSWNAKYDKPSGGIPSTDMSSDVQTSLEKAGTAVQDVSGKEDKTNKTSTIDENSTNTQYPNAKAVYDNLVLRDEEISNLKTKNELLVKDHVPIENTGTELQLTGTGDLPMELIPYGNITQETTSISEGDEYDSPSIEHESPVKVVDGEYEILAENKNLFNKNNVNNIIQGFFYNKTLTQYNNITKTFYMPCVPNTTYVVSKILSTRFDVATTSQNIEFGIVCDNKISSPTSTSITITSGVNYKYLLCYYYNTNSDTLTEEQIRNSIQVEKGSIATSYIAHAEQNVTIDTLPNPLYSENDCYKYLTSEQAIALGLNTGAGWYAYNELFKDNFNTFSSSNVLYSYSFGDYIRYIIINNTNQKLATNSNTVFCNYFKNINARWTTPIQNGIFSWENNNQYALDLSNSYDTVDKVVDLLNSLNDFYIISKLATPTYTKITDTDLINSLEALKDMQSYYNITNISQTHSDGQADMIINAKALKSIKAMQSEIDNLISRVTLLED